MAIGFRKGMEGTVETGLQVVEVAYYGKGWWTWWKVLEPCLEHELEGEDESK